ncbi:hypothetical protein [Rhodopila globiformis]|uniref:Uncharacterized protein n=1 Tax=Rhodopila globiformis TaxID=1071 RepID=A0A2S6NBD5_RHOGL|nr:hypothetical protein [Rhodopila globiformis]PPQ31923.1 hypothetical protein CCS01_16245 [Rhodopila globiformis]
MKVAVYEAFRSLGIAEDKSLKAAEALSARDTDVDDLKSDMRLVKWMVGALIGLCLIILGSTFTLMPRVGDLGGQISQIARSGHP